MTKQQKTNRDIETLRESIRLDFKELANTKQQTDRIAIWQHIKWCTSELQLLCAT